MLLGTHPIPARSPAEREGQIEKEMRRESWGERGRQKRRGGGGSGECASVDGMILRRET